MENNANCRRLMQSLSEASFYMQDLKLYLDTHPDDDTATEMFREACRQYKTCKEAFECSYYPLTPCGSRDDSNWDWLCGAWPPERM